MRFDNILNSSWELKDINISDCGVWPKMGNLPPQATYGNAEDTAQYVKYLLDNKNLITLETARVLYIENLTKYAPIIAKHLPIIVFEGDIIRHNKIRRPIHLENYQKCKYDINDGNHRCVALSLLGYKTITALVGKRKFKNDLMFF